MADDQTPQDPQVPVSTTNQSASSDTNRPDSTIMADPTQSATTDDRPISTILADPTSTSADSANDATLSDTSNLANTPNPADSSPSNLANDQPTAPVSPQPVSVEEKPLEASVVPEPPKEETPSQAISSEVGQVLDSPISPNLANPPDLPDDTSTIQSQPPLPEEKPSEQPIPFETSPPQVGQPEPTKSTSTSDLSTSSNLTNLSPISVSLPDNQAPQVQSEAPNDASNIDTEKTPDQLASLNPEPTESPQIAPLADSDSVKSTPGTFGDLLSDNTSPTSPPGSPQTASSPTSPSSSFGDLIKDIKPEESLIQPPTTPPIPPPQNSQPVPSQSPLPAEASAKEGTSPSSSLVVNRFKANQARVQRRNAHLNKIIELVKTKGKITNKDIREALRVSQSTATNYLSELVHQGSLKIEKHAKATFYTI